MSNFNPNYNKLAPFEWQDKALQYSTDNKSSFLPIAGLVFGILAASSTGFPPTGLLIFAWAVYEAFKRNNHMGRNELAITQYKCVAHCLSEDDFRDFRTQVGDEEILRQLQWARSNNYRLSEIAEDYLDAQPAPRQLIEQNTGLNALPVMDFNEKAPGVGSSKSTEIVSFDKPTPDLSAMLAQSMKNSLIIGVPGAGKGVFVSNALEAVKRDRRHQITVFYLDPKGDVNESGYFAGRVDKLYRADVITQSPDEIYDWLVKSLQDFHSAKVNGMKLLILDELTALAGILKTVKGASQWLRSRITSYSSSGSSRGIILWGIAQNAHIANLGFDGGTRSIFIPVFLISSDQVTASADILRSGMIPEDKKLDTDAIKRLCSKSEIGRAIFYGGLNEWFPATKMTNFSGFDRDTRTFLPGFVPPKQERTASDFQAISKLEDAFRLEPLNISESSNKTDKGLSDNAKLVLSLFNNATKKTPKSTKDLKEANKLRQLSDGEILLALRELVINQNITFDAEGRYLNPDW